MKLKPGYLLLLAIVLFAVTILGMRYNNVEVNNMKAQILEQDRAGEDVQGRVEGELKDFVFTHMNADVHIVLEGAYARATAQRQAEIDASVDGSVYEDAEEACDRENLSAQENAECFQDYVASQLDAGDDAQVRMPELSEFSYIYYSPIWALDVPGISLLSAIILSFAGFLLYLRDGIRSIKNKQRD